MCGKKTGSVKADVVGGGAASLAHGSLRLPTTTVTFMKHSSELWGGGRSRGRTWSSDPAIPTSEETVCGSRGCGNSCAQVQPELSPRLPWAHWGLNVSSLRQHL